MTRPGDYTIMARAHSESGQTQPFEYNPDNLGYLVNLVLPRQVHVAATERAEDKFADAGAWRDTLQAYAEENTRRSLDLDLVFTGGGGI